MRQPSGRRLGLPAGRQTGAARRAPVRPSAAGPRPTGTSSWSAAGALLVRCWCATGRPAGRTYRGVALADACRVPSCESHAAPAAVRRPWRGALPRRGALPWRGALPHSSGAAIGKSAVAGQGRAGAWTSALLCALASAGEFAMSRIGARCRVSVGAHGKDIVTMCDRIHSRECGCGGGYQQVRTDGHCQEAGAWGWRWSWGCALKEGWTVSSA